MDLQVLSLQELYALRDQVEAEVVRLQSAEKIAALAKVQALMAQHGLSTDDLQKKAAAPRKPVEAKYQNPVDPSQTWTGRGRKPLWVRLPG
ncbi:H-NS histone family protein [Vogesella indigofera]|uniref:H-NS histone family protein n=1 Tax=Vogesella indigofera TaxID=45465 RepID=A0ABT5I2H7_VOGIN|nr:H-NS histone family protein [Vogesella indigofera]MDC7690382.1 H-NS histone family protein [Vogesella indigofera]